MTDRPAGERPLLRVVRGDPTTEELAALVAVLAARSRAGTAGPAHPGRRTAGGWADPTKGLRRPIYPGPGAWRAAGRVAGTRTTAGR